jgi:hypothetical protein
MADVRCRGWASRFAIRSGDAVQAIGLGGCGRSPDVVRNAIRYDGHHALDRPALRHRGLEPVAAPALLALDVAALASLAAPEETPLLAPESVLPRQAATDKRALTAQ